MQKQCQAYWHFWIRKSQSHSAFPRWWFVGTELGGERRQGGWLSTQLTRFNDDDHQHHHHLTTDQLGHHRMHKFCLSELPQRRWWEAGWTHFAKWRSMPPQHHWILWLEHRPGILNHNVRCESTSWLIIFAQTNISQKCWRSLAFLTTQFDNFRITPASVTSTTLPKSTVWTLCGRWRGSTSTSTGGSLRWSPPVLLDRYPPIPAMSLSWCWFFVFLLFTSFDKVRAMYQKITTSIKIEDNSTSSVSVHYTSDCNGRKTEKKR